MVAGGDGDTEAALKDFDFLPSEEGGGEARSVEGEENWGNLSNSLAKMKEEFRNEQKDRRGGGGHRPKKSHLQDMLNNLNKEGSAELTSQSSAPDPYPRDTQLPDTNFLTQEAANEASSFGLGELAALTVNNDSESGPYDVSVLCFFFRKLRTSVNKLTRCFFQVTHVSSYTSWQGAPLDMDFQLAHSFCR